MDDFFLGSDSFDLYFNSSDDKVIINLDGTYTFVLNKMLQIANEWEIGIKNIIIKSPLVIPDTKISYLSQDNPDQKTF